MSILVSYKNCETIHLLEIFQYATYVLETKFPHYNGIQSSVLTTLPALIIWLIFTIKHKSFVVKTICVYL